MVREVVVDGQAVEVGMADLSDAPRAPFTPSVALEAGGLTIGGVRDRHDLRLGLSRI